MRVILSILILPFVLAGCQRPEGEFSKLTVSLPSDPGSLQKVGTLISTAWPTGKKFCYGVNVTGDGIESETDACSPVLGTHAGFSADGKISLDIRKGSERTVDVYVYLAETSQACPDLSKSPSVDRRKIYLIGTQSHVDTSKDETAVAIQASYPGDNAHIAAQLGLTAACWGSGTLPMGPNKARVSLGTGHGTGANNSTMKTRVRAIR